MVGLRRVLAACWGSVLRFTPRGGVVHAYDVHEKGEDFVVAGRTRCETAAFCVPQCISNVDTTAIPIGRTCVRKPLADPVALRSTRLVGTQDHAN